MRHVTTVHAMGLGSAIVALALAACRQAVDPNRVRDFDVVGTWALTSINGQALPQEYYATGTGRYLAMADTLVMMPDSTCTVRFTQGVYRVDVASDTSTIFLNGACTWSVVSDTLRIWNFIPSFRSSYRARTQTAGLLLIDFEIGAGAGIVQVWSLLKAP